MDASFKKYIQAEKNREKTIDDYVSETLLKLWAVTEYKNDHYIRVIGNYLKGIGVKDISLVEYAIDERLEALVAVFFTDHLKSDADKNRALRYLNYKIKSFSPHAPNAVHEGISELDINYSEQHASQFYNLEKEDKVNSPFEPVQAPKNSVYKPSEDGVETDDLENDEQIELIDDEFYEIDAEELVRSGLNITGSWDEDDGDFDQPHINDELFFLDTDELLQESTDSADAYLAIDKERVSLEERALQTAVCFVDEFNLSEVDLPLLKEIFYINIRGWGTTYAALRREFSKGLTTEELYLAHQFRRVWALNDRFWCSYRRNGSYENNYYSLPWTVACLAAKSFNCIPCNDEIEAILNDIYLAWLQDSDLRFRFISFSIYLASHFLELENNWHLYPFSTHSWPYSLQDSNYSDLGLTDQYNNRKEKLLQNLGFEYIYLV